MHEYDAALKMLLRASTDSLFRQMGGVSVARWLNIEIQEVSVSRLDLLGASADGETVQVELQSTNDPQIRVMDSKKASQTGSPFSCSRFKA